MFVARIPNRSSPPTFLIRESYRDGPQVKTRTLANITGWAPARIEALRRLLRGELPADADERPLADRFDIIRSRPHGHVAAVVGTLRKVGLDLLLDSRRSRPSRLCAAMVAARILDPASKLATARGLDPETVDSTLGQVLGVDSADEDELYAAMDWLRPRQERLEAALAARHLVEGSLVLYDVTSTYFEGRTCPLARLGHPRDGKKGKLQIVIGLLCSAEGCPVAVEVFEGNTGDPKTLGSFLRKLRERFHLRELVLVGDRGMLTAARIREELREAEGVGWITALRAPAIRKLAEGGTLQLSLFDEKDLAEVTSPDYPGERLIVCRNPLLAAERARKRQELLAATEVDLAKIAAATGRPRNPLRGKENIGLKVGKVLGRYKVGKHFRLHITETGFRFDRDDKRIAAEAALDGIYVIRTSVSAQRLGPDETVRSYKKLSEVERAFRCLKSVDLHVRPIHHRRAHRVRAHVLLCMLAYYVEWHMRRALAPILFEDEDKAAAETLRRSVVAPAQRSDRARSKAHTKRTEDGKPVHSFQTLLEDLSTLAKQRVQPRGEGTELQFDKLTSATATQQRAFDLLGVTPMM
jgi:transposase